MQIASKGYRITALEKQLETTTRESSREIARLRTKLFELEMNAMSSEADDQDVNNFSLFDNPDFQVPAEFRKFHQIDEDDSGSGMKHNGSGKSLPSGSGSTAVNALRKTNSNTGNDDNIIDPEVLSEKLKHVEIDGARPEKTDSPELPEDIGKSLSDKGMRRISPNESVQRNISAKLNIDDGTLPVLAEGPDGMEDSRNVSMDDYDVMPTVKDRKQPLERIASAEGSPEKIPSNRSINVEKDGEILRTNNDVIDLKKTEDVTADIDTSNLLTNSTKIPKLEQKIARRLSTVSAFPKGKRVTKEVYIMDTNEDKPTACGRLKITFHTDTELKISDDPIIEQTIHNYWISKVEFRNEKKVDTKDHYNPYISFQIGTIWRGQTDVIEDTGLIAEWEYNQMEIESCGMMFSLTDDELKTNSILQCQVSDQSGYDDEDLLIGSGTMFLALEN